MRLVIIGPPGAGKGTQGALLARALKIPRYSTGDILRDALRSETVLGREAGRYMDAGELVPDDVMLGIVDDAVGSPDSADGFLLDGFPRTVVQAVGLQRILGERGMRLDAIVDLAVDDDEIVQRISARRVCAECGYITRVVDEADDAACGGCGGRLELRADDAPETVRRRLEVYRAQTEPVLDWYRRTGVAILEVDGVGPVEEIQRRIMNRLGR